MYASWMINGNHENEWQRVSECTLQIIIPSHLSMKDQISLDEFYVLLTVHLGIILVNNQLDAQFLFLCVYFNSLHVLEQPRAHHENQLHHHNIWYMSFWKEVNGLKLQKVYLKMHYL
jgi:hypothetical protein